MSGKYDDIIHLPHPTSNKHPRMSIRDRAAMFSPFAALSGHGAAIAETARLTDRRMELDEDTRAELDQKQTVLLEHIGEQPEVTVTWFQPDERKDGGSYVTATGRLKKIDEAARTLILLDGSFERKRAKRPVYCHKFQQNEYCVPRSYRGGDQPYFLAGYPKT